MALSQRHQEGAEETRAELYSFGYPLLKCYWFLFQPRTSGARCILVCKHHLLLIRQTYGDQLWPLPGGGLAQGETPRCDYDGYCMECAEDLALRYWPFWW